MSVERIEAVYEKESGNLFISHITTFEETVPEIKTMFFELMIKEPSVLKMLEKMGFKSYDQKLRQFVICRFGGNDSHPDFDIETGSSVSDYCHCGSRGNCQGEGFEGLCSLPVIDNVVLTRTEVDIIAKASCGMTAKEISNSRFTSVLTVKAQFRNLFQRVGLNNCVSAIFKAIKAGII